MSNPNTPQKKETEGAPPKKKPSHASDKNSTSESAQFLATLKQAVAAIETAQEINARMLERERPIADFHAAVENVSDNDIRIYWDIRIVRGSSTPFTHSTGVTSMPGILSDKLRIHAVSMIEREIGEKVGAPIGAAFMEEAERQALQNTSRIANLPLVSDGYDDPAPKQSGGLLSVASAHEQETQGNSDHEEEADNE